MAPAGAIGPQNAALIFLRIDDATTVLAVLVCLLQLVQDGFVVGLGDVFLQSFAKDRRFARLSAREKARQRRGRFTCAVRGVDARSDFGALGRRFTVVLNLFGNLFDEFLQ